jgi:hypothetical protein
VRDPQTRFVSLAALVLLCLIGTAAADPQAAAGAAAQVQAAAADDPDLSPTPMQPDFYLVNLPTTLRLPKYKLAFRVTHRFTRPVNQGSTGETVGDLFGLDSGAEIGLELRFAPMRGTQVGFYRTNDKTIDLFASYNLLRSIGTLPIAISANGSIEGTNNFRDKYSPSAGAVVTATLAKRVAFTLVPTWVNNANPLPQDLVDHNDTVYLGVGGRLRVTKRMYFVAEASPRLSGFKGGNVDLQGTAKYVEGKTLVSFAIEGQVGGHVFQVNLSNAFATTPANIARGAASGRTNWYLGFNISRKFY